MNDCSCNGTLLSWVAGNDVLLLARVYEKVLDAGEVTDLPFDLSACDDISVTATAYKTEKMEWAIAEDESNCLAVNIPHTLTVGEWAVEITCKRNGYHVRSFEFTFRIVETNCEAQTTFEVVDGCQSASVRVALQIVPQALVRGQNSYEAWKELPGNEGKTLQEYIDEVLDLNAITAAAREAADAANTAAASASDTETAIETAEAARVTAEAGRVANENTRIVNEEAREGREVVRENNETGRVQSESTRVQSEFSRVQAERGRVASETNREEAEAQREADCAAAVSAANAAATGAEKVNAVLSGNTLTVTNRNGVSTTTNVKGEKGDTGATGAQGAKGDKGDKGDQGNPGVGVPVGGSTGQVLAKKSASDYDTEWVEQSGGYEPPVGGIPKTDLAADVQTSLGKADTAIQDISGKQDKIDSSHKLSADLITDGSTNKTVTQTEKNSWNGKQPAISAQNKLSADLVEDGATNKSYTATEKTKLAGIASGAEVNVQANWNETNTSSDAYIQNKPTDLAHIGDAQGSATTANFDPETDTVHITAQVLSSAAQAQARSNIGAGTSNFSGSYNDLTDKPTIPDAVSGTNDGTNWTSITIGSTTKAIPSGGGSGDVSGKEDKMAVDSTAKTASFTAEVSKYYTVNIAASGSVTITLPVPSDTSHTLGIVFLVSTSTSPTLIFTVASGTSIYKSAGYSINASKIYEVTALWNGAAWFIASSEMVAQS